MQEFIDRKSDFPNRRRLEIVSQTPNEIIADIYREEGNVDITGTAIDANTLNGFKDELNSWKNIVATNGTLTYIGANKVGEVNFDSDPQEQIDTINNNVSVLQTNKANLDAGNLTTDNIDSWQNKLNDLPNLIDIQNAQSVSVNVYLSGQATVKETYLSSDRLSWYRIWSDGWKECGGIATRGVLCTYPSITFKSNPTIQCTYTSYTSASSSDSPIKITTSDNTSGFKWNTAHSYDNSAKYYACGY